MCVFNQDGFGPQRSLMKKEVSGTHKTITFTDGIVMHRATERHPNLKGSDTEVQAHLCPASIDINLVNIDRE